MKLVVEQRQIMPARWENDETGSRVNGPRSLTNHLIAQEVG